MQRAAEARGGTCVSKRYLGVDTKLRWRCAEGHTWKTTPYLVLNGSWCPECVGRRPPGKMLATMRATARERGGRLLSRSYEKAKSDYEWRCAKGHRWDRSWDQIKGGSWCPRCVGRIPPAEALAQLKGLARARGGRLLSRRYVNSSTKVEVRCAEGHEWSVTPSDLRNGRWCGRCAGNVRLSFDELRAIADGRGGALVSKRYGAGPKLRWRCAKGHVWAAPATRIKAGGWCPKCAAGPRYTLEDMQRVARARGGECVSKRFVTMNHRLRWRCAEGHEWRATGSQVATTGTWCAACVGLARGTIAEMRELARKRGGRCRSRRYVNTLTALSWSCAEGHRWEATPGSVKRGAWCPYCQRKGIRGIETYLLADLARLAEERGGACLSTEYINAQDPLRFRCQLDHEWEATPGSIVLGTWCPECAHTKKPPLELFATLARERGGRCLSKRYRNARTRLEFECREGHRWRTLPAVVRRGSWCPECARAEPAEPTLLDLGDVTAIAARIGGECLSPSYEGLQRKLDWRCREGHEWQASPSSILAGAWCPACMGRTPLTIEDMRASAANRGGRCLSKAYAGVRGRLRWRCAKGHTWSATGQTVRNGSWCPTCLLAAPDAGIARVCELARGHGGVCLSARHHDPSKRLRWRCAEGHVWRAVEAVVVAGAWCPLCP